eukprot:15476473-Alexandrium_andersonii.AAC.2
MCGVRRAPLKTEAWDALSEDGARVALASMPDRTGVGLDSWEPAATKVLPSSAMGEFANLLWPVEKHVFVATSSPP